MSAAIELVGSFSVLLELGVIALVLTRGLRARRRLVPRAVLLGLAVAAAVVLPRLAAEELAAHGGEVSFVVMELAKFVPLFLALFASAYLLFDVTPWTGLLCAAAGYTMQNLASSLHSLVGVAASALGVNLGNAVSIPLSIALCAACALVFRRGVDVRQLRGVRGGSLVVLFVLVVPLVMGFDLLVRELETSGAPAGQVAVLRVFHVATCVFLLLQERSALYVTRLREECEDARRLLDLRAEQREGQGEALAAANARCHDMRRLLDDLRSLERSPDPAILADLDEQVREYDAYVRTGNEALDALLTERRLACAREGIALTCVADGPALGFLSPLDLYALVGNAVDNAVEAVRRLADEDRRVISVEVRRRNSMVSIHVENYFDGRIERGRDGLPKTTKPDRAGHGVGMSSMRLVAEKYQGSLAYGVRGDVFRLDVLLPAA